MMRLAVKEKKNWFKLTTMGSISSCVSLPCHKWESCGTFCISHSSELIFSSKRVKIRGLAIGFEDDVDFVGSVILGDGIVVVVIVNIALVSVGTLSKGIFVVILKRELLLEFVLIAVDAVRLVANNLLLPMRGSTDFGE